MERTTFKRILVMVLILITVIAAWVLLPDRGHGQAYDSGYPYPYPAYPTYSYSAYPYPAPQYYYWYGYPATGYPVVTPYQYEPWYMTAYPVAPTETEVATLPPEPTLEPDMGFGIVQEQEIVEATPVVKVQEPVFVKVWKFIKKTFRTITQFAR